jgi:hypothetical protein
MDVLIKPIAQRQFGSSKASLPKVRILAICLDRILRLPRHLMKILFTLSVAVMHLCPPLGMLLKWMF